MGLHHNPRIVTDGLMLALDAANPKSYPGTGTTWYDMSGSGLNGTMNSITYDAEAMGTMRSTGVNTSYILISSVNLTASDFTVMVATRYAGATQGRVISGYSNNWLLGHHGGTNPDYYATGWVLNTGTGDSNWGIYTGTGNISGDRYSFWRDDTKLVTDSPEGSAGPTDIVFGKYISTEFSTALCSFIFAYDRVLTDAEVAQNYETMRGRFGL